MKEALWLKGFISELKDSLVIPVVYCDNQGAVQLTKNQIYHERTKHINVKLHFIRDVIKAKEVELREVDTMEHGAKICSLKFFLVQNFSIVWSC